MRTFLIAAATTALLAASPAPAAWAEDSLRDKVIGTWKLISWESLRSNGEVVNVWMGLHPTGVIMYQPNGYMAVQIMADPRPTFADNPATTPPSYEELRNAFFGYYAYWGRYSINNTGDGVVHDVQASERPGEVGLKYPRSVSIDGAKLVITTPAYKASLLLPGHIRERAQIREDEELVNRLTWQRAE